MKPNRTTLLLTILAGGCSDPLYYPQIERDFGDTSGSIAAFDPNDPSSLEAAGVPCSDDSNPIPTTLTVDNQHPVAVELYLYWSDCTLLYQMGIAGGQSTLNGYSGQTLIFTNSPATELLTWVQVAPDGSTRVVIP